MIQTDIGRPIGDITAKILIDDLVERAQDVLDTLVRQEVEVQDKMGNWYSMRTAPYRTLENVIDGVVLTFVDIGKLKQVEDLNRLAKVVLDSNDAITIQDFDRRQSTDTAGESNRGRYTGPSKKQANQHEIFSFYFAGISG